MTVVGDDIIQVCRRCFVQHGFGLRLKPAGDQFVCPHDASHRYRIRNGELETL